MLVLTRSIGESIFINGEEIKLQVLEINGKNVRLGIKAPQHINILREEVFNRINNDSFNVKCA